MAYEKHTWTNVHGETPITAEKLNEMEQGIEDAAKTGGVEVGTIVHIEDDAPVPEGYVEVENDGGIITITNDNGTAIKYPDGTMICTKKIELTDVAVTNTFGGIYMSEAFSFGSFAEAFVDNAPTVSYTLSTSVVAWVSTSNYASTTYAGAGRIMRGTSYTIPDIRINITAIGRWK